MRKTDNDAIFRDAAADVGKVTLDKISWFVPHVIPAVAEQFSIYKTIESKVKLPVAYRTRQCDMFSVNKFHLANEFKNITRKTEIYHCWLPNNKRWRSIKKPSVVDHINLENAYVMLSSDRSPAVDYHLSFPNQTFSRAYSDAAIFEVKFFGMDKFITQSNITPGDYKTLYPRFVFDVSKQKERLKSSVVDIQIKLNSLKMFQPTHKHMQWSSQTRCCHSSLTVTKCL